MEDRVVNLRAYGRIFLRRWWIFILGATIAVLPVIYGSSTVIGYYSATAKVLVEGGQTLNEVMVNQQLATYYTELISTKPILEEVIRRLSLPLQPSELAGKITVNIPSRLLQIRATDPDPRLASAIANTTAAAFIDDFRDRQLTQLARLQASLGQYGIAQNPDVVASQVTAMNSLTIVEPATSPSSPYNTPETSRNIILAGVLGLILAGLGILILESMDDVIRTPQDLDAIAGLESLGQMNGRVNLGSILRHTPADNSRIVSIDSMAENSALTEAYKYVALNLEFSAPSDGLRTIMITSAVPGEGKTTTAANVAISIAREGKSVVLVDSDLRKPSLHEVFGLENHKGLTNVLMGHALVEEVLLPTPVETLLLMPSGPAPPDPTLALRSHRFEEMVQELQDRADVLIFDSPPVLVVADALVLSARVQGVLVVVDSGKTGGGLY